MVTAAMGTVLRQIRRLTGGDAPERSDRDLLDAFVDRRDEAAFAGLVSRHGPMVLRACRRVLGHEQDAEDAFQATFLVLARNAARIRRREALAGWLHGVARRTAMKAKRTAARRRAREGRMALPAPPSSPGLLWDEVRTVLDEEVQRLVEPFRSAFVLCVLEGKPGPEAAAALGCKQATLYTRMNRARRLLQTALARRGIELASLLAALAVADGVAKAAPGVLLRSAVYFGLLDAAGGSAARVIPAHVAELATGVTRAMFLTRAKIATAVLLTACLVAGAAALTHRAPAADAADAAKPGTFPKTSTPRHAAEDTQNAVTCAGRVIDPDGAPVAGARLYLRGEYQRGQEYSRQELAPAATTGPDGRFRFMAAKATIGDKGTITALATNYGAGWTEVSAHAQTQDLTLRLVKDDVPITGQIVDLEGKPVAGAILRLVQINAAPGDDLGPWIEAVKARKGLDVRLPYPYQMLELRYLPRITTAVAGKATTDAAGRFRLTGIGRNRLARVQLDGPTIVSQYLRILTRPGPTMEATWGGDGQFLPRSIWSYYGANFRHAAAPTKPIVGVVRDKDTKEPVAGVTIRSLNGLGSGTNVQTMTDARGRYRLTGMPKGTDNQIVALPPRDLPYIAVRSAVPDSSGLDPVTINLDLKRGIWVEGKITDKATGKGVSARVEYFALSTNPNLGAYPGFEAANLDRDAASADGSYRVIGLPGPGLVAARCDAGRYLRATERDDEFGKEGSEDGDLDTLPLSLMPMQYGAVASIDPAKDVHSVKRDLTLDPGWTFTGTVLGPDGRPLSGARGLLLTNGGWLTRWDREPRKTAAFTVRPFNPRRPCEIIFRHLERGLVGVVRPPERDGGTVTVRMAPGAVVTGRLIDADGRPRAGVELRLRFRSTENALWQPFSPDGVKTDRDGRFRIGALIPGFRYQLSDQQGELVMGQSLRSGQTKNLGDVRLEMPPP